MVRLDGEDLVLAGCFGFEFWCSDSFGIAHSPYGTYLLFGNLSVGRDAGHLRLDG